MPEDDHPSRLWPTNSEARPPTWDALLFLLGAIQHLVIRIDRAVVVVAIRPAGGIEHREAAGLGGRPCWNVKVKVMMLDDCGQDEADETGEDDDGKDFH